MNFENKKVSVNKKLIIFIVVVLLVIVGTGVFIFLQTRPEKIETTEEKPAFTFHTTQLSGWYTGGNNWVNPDEFTGDQARKDELPKADISIHQGKNEQDIVNGHCFTILTYQDAIINTEEQVKKDATSKMRDSSLTVSEIGVNDLKITTHEGIKNVKLHKYDLSGPAAKDLQRGMANGYVELSKGHIRLQSVCQESSQLDETLPVFAATSLDIRNTEK